MSRRQDRERGEGKGRGSLEWDADPQAWTSLILLERYRRGDDRAADALFARYFERLTLLARSRLSSRLARRTDPEDVVMSVYRSFFVEARDGRFVLGRGGDLWRLLASMTRHKLSHHVRHQTADRRTIERECSLDRAEGLAGPPSEQGPSPEEAVALADELEHLFSRLSAFGRACWNSGCRGSISRRSQPRPGVRSARSDGPWARSACSWPGGLAM